MSITTSAPPNATTDARGLMSAADKTKLDAQSGTNTGDVTVSSPAGWLSRVGQALTFALVAAGDGVSGVVTAAAQSLYGVKTFMNTLIASAGIQVGALWNTNGTSASDVGVKLGVSTADGSVNASARLAQISTGIGGAETARYYWTKDTMYLGGGGLWSALIGAEIFWRTSSTSIFALLPSGIARSGYGFDVNPGFGAFLSFQVTSTGLVNQRGTDSSGTPGSRTGVNAIDRPNGISAIAAGASSCQIDNSLVTASSHIVITPLENAGNNAEFRSFKVSRAAGSFTVTVSSSVTNTWPFAWRIATLLTS